MEAAQPLRGSSEDRHWLLASCQIFPIAADVPGPFLGVSACFSVAARSAVAIAGLVCKLGYAAIGVRRPAAAACATQTFNFRWPGIRVASGAFR